MNQEDIRLVQASVPILEEHAETLTRLFYKNMLSNHPELKNIFNLANQALGQQQKSLALSVLAYAKHIEHPEVLLPALELIGQKHRSLQVVPEQYPIVGKYLLGALQELLDLPDDAPILGAWGRAYQQLADILIEMEAKMYATAEAPEAAWSDWRKFELVKKEELAPNVYHLYLSPSDGQEIPLHRPGQYLSLRLFFKELGVYQARQYSLNSRPNNNYYRITVKAQKGAPGCPMGRLSNALHQAMKIGDEVELTVPAGNFHLEQKPSPSVFLGAGVGVSPLWGLLQALIDSQTEQPILWMDAYKSADEQLFAEELRSLENQLQLKHFYEDQNGRMQLDEALKAPFGLAANYYLCGPAGFMQAQRQQLRQAGIPEEQIHLEEFNPVQLQLS